MQQLEQIEQQTREKPDWQSPDTIKRLIERSKPGDILMLGLKGRKQLYVDAAFRKEGCILVFCVGNKPSEDSIVMWSPFIDAEGVFFKSLESRTFTINDIRSIKVTPAEVYIPEATAQKFQYNSLATVNTKRGRHLVFIDKFFNNVIEGTTLGGVSVCGSIHAFRPYHPGKPLQIP